MVCSPGPSFLPPPLSALQVRPGRLSQVLEISRKFQRVPVSSREFRAPTLPTWSSGECSGGGSHCPILLNSLWGLLLEISTLTPFSLSQSSSATCGPEVRAQVCLCHAASPRLWGDLREQGVLLTSHTSHNQGKAGPLPRVQCGKVGWSSNPGTVLPPSPGHEVPQGLCVCLR